MKNRAIQLIVATLLAVLVSVGANAQTRSETVTDTGAIFPKGRRAPTNTFTGTVWVQQLIEADSAFNIPVGYVTFEPGARSYWHSHAGGQVLLAMGGIGYYQERGNRTAEAADSDPPKRRRGKMPAQRTSLARCFAHGRIQASRRHAQHRYRARNLDAAGNRCGIH